MTGETQTGYVKYQEEGRLDEEDTLDDARKVGKDSIVRQKK